MSNTAPHPQVAPSAPATPAGAARRPRDDEIDAFGLTHPGKRRPENQDHFLFCSLKRFVEVHGTSLPAPEQIANSGGRLAFLAMVADGVGGGAHGEEASRLAVEAVTAYIDRSIGCYYASDASDQTTFHQALQDAAYRCHADVVRRTDEDAGMRGMATTLTLWMGVWPHAYLLQVGDSRCYLLRDGVLRQISRDQTMEQELVDQGILPPERISTTPFAHVLSSAIGGSQTAPVVTRIDQRWGDVGLLCSDGLTRHVPDEQIRDRLLSMTSARQVCEQLLQDALDGGGSDNVTIVVGRATPRDLAQARVTGAGTA